jgi:nucleotide-binding universal stress UspA family protein
MLHQPTVLCPVDFSDPSRAALEYASAIAEHFGGRLIVLTVNDPFLAEAAAAAGYEPSFTADTEYELRRFAAEGLAHRAPAARTTEFSIAVGKAAPEIVRQAREHHADLIVMGSHGRSGFRKTFFGSTTERVLRETTVPVLVTPVERPAAASLSEIASRIGRIVAPVDMSDASKHQVRVAAGLAQALSVPLVLAHVLEPVFIPASVRQALSSADASRRAQVEERLDALVTLASAHAKVESVILSGEPPAEIVKLADTRGAHLIVMGLHSAGLLGPRMGSVTYRVLCLAHDLVLAVPPTAVAAGVADRVTV